MAHLQKIKITKIKHNRSVLFKFLAHIATRHRFYKNENKMSKDHDVSTDKPEERQNSSLTRLLPSAPGTKFESSLSCQQASMAVQHSATDRSPNNNSKHNIYHSTMLSVAQMDSKFQLCTLFNFSQGP